jgi:hypothetical protein
MEDLTSRPHPSTSSRSSLLRIFGVDPIDFDDLAEATRQLLSSLTPDSDLHTNRSGGIRVVGSNLVRTGS